MTIRALSVRSPGAPFPGKLSVATLAVFVVSNIQLANLAVSFLWIVTCGALLDGLSLLPDVFPVLVVVVARIAGINITFGMFCMRKINRAFAVGPVNLVVDEHFIGKFLLFGSICGGNYHQKWTKRNT
jgi:hypothetical protein